MSRKDLCQGNTCVGEAELDRLYEEAVETTGIHLSACLNYGHHSMEAGITEEWFKTGIERYRYAAGLAGGRVEGRSYSLQHLSQDTILIYEYDSVARMTERYEATGGYVTGEHVRMAQEAVKQNPTYHQASLCDRVVAMREITPTLTPEEAKAKHAALLESLEEP